jgi:hypothetical protein
MRTARSPAAQGKASSQGSPGSITNQGASVVAEPICLAGWSAMPAYQGLIRWVKVRQPEARSQLHCAVQTMRPHHTVYARWPSLLSHTCCLHHCHPAAMKGASGGGSADVVSSTQAAACHCTTGLPAQLLQQHDDYCCVSGWPCETFQSQTISGGHTCTDSRAEQGLRTIATGLPSASCLTPDTYIGVSAGRRGICLIFSSATCTGHRA